MDPANTGIFWQNALRLLLKCIIKFYDPSLLITSLMQEFKTIHNFKRRTCNEKSADLEPWDEDYFIGMMKSSVYDLDASVCAKLASP
jgi:Zn-dependent oligopeptidase